MGHPNEFVHLISSSISIKLTKNSMWAILLLLAIMQRVAEGELNEQLYEKHCQNFVPASKLAHVRGNFSIDEAHRLGFHQASYEGGESIFNTDAFTWNPRSKSVSFSIYQRSQTGLEDVFKIDGRLTIRSRRYGLPLDRGFARTSPFKRTRQPRFNPRVGVLVVTAEGFWSSRNNRLCMIGSAYRYFSNGTTKDLLVSLKFSYPENRTLMNSLITGTLESLEGKENEKYFEPISITAAYDGNYEYTRVQDAKRVCSLRNPDVLDANIDVLKKDVSVCNFNWLSKPLDLVWNHECTGSDCSPFNLSDPKFLPSSMFIQNLQCNPNGQMHGSFGFSTSWNTASRFALPETMVIGEGQWDGEMGQLCMVACRLEDGGRVLKMLTEEDCGISITMQFPLTLTVLNRYTVVGHMLSAKKVNDTMYFKNFTFKGPAGIGQGMKAIRDLPRLQYKYTKLNQVKHFCKKTLTDKKFALTKTPEQRYPDGSSFGDLRFDASIVNSDKQKAWGFVSPLTIEDSFDRPLQFLATNTTFGAQGFNNGHRQLNVSYTLQFGTSTRFKWEGSSQANALPESIPPISAEGIYDTETGSLCMIGCRHVDLHADDLEGDMDCQILIEVEYGPSNPELYHTKQISGNIRSLRTEKDPLHFRPMKLVSTTVYIDQAKNTLWRKDLEIIMRLISLSLGAVFIGIQLLYIRRHSNLLPFLSLLMLTVLTLGHMIPLVLNFEAFFMNEHRQNVLQWSGGWLEVNEVVVRVMTMVAFLLQLRLLQLAWTAKLAAARNSAWFWERKVLYVCVPLYVFGGLIACFVHWVGTSHSVNPRFLQENSQHALWEDFRSYAGLILDGFLLPQVLGNLFWDIREKVLVPYFYIGFTLVRSLPHAYDAYRAIRYIPQYSSSYFYANPDWDLYSTAWDIVIPCGALLLALLVFLQQRYGGRCIVPRRFRDGIEYQKVPVVDG